jgi:hypothetical protein
MVSDRIHGHGQMKVQTEDANCMVSDRIHGHGQMKVQTEDANACMVSDRIHGHGQMKVQTEDANACIGKCDGATASAMVLLMLPRFDTAPRSSLSALSPAPAVHSAVCDRVHG